MKKTREEIWLIEFGEHFRSIRRSKNFTQEDLANEADIDESQVSRIERGITNPSVLTLLSIADVLDISPFDFFTFKTTVGKKK